MTFIKSSLTELISIYISLFLIFSPLQAQSKGRAKLYTKTGTIVGGNIIKIEENSIIFAELLNTGKLREQKVPNSMIYKLISPSGEVLIENVAFESEFKSNVELFPDRIKSYVFPDRIKDYERKEPDKFSIVSWHITTSNGDRLEVSKVQIINDDSLLIVSNQFEQYIAINLITEIKRIKNSHIIKKSLLFGLGGLAISEGVAAIIVSQDTDELARLAFIVLPILFVPPALVLGAVYGAVAGRDKNYDMTGWSTAQKRVKIQEIMNSE